MKNAAPGSARLRNVAARIGAFRELLILEPAGAPRSEGGGVEGRGRLRGSRGGNSERSLHPSPPSPLLETGTPVAEKLYF